MTILAIDVGLKTGWAVLVDGRIISGVQSMGKGGRKEHPGRRFILMDEWLDTLYTAYAPDLVAYEMPCHLKGDAILSQNGFIACLLKFVAKHKYVNYMPVAPKTIKFFAAGRGNAPKDAIKHYFFLINARRAKDDNEADAYALLRYVMHDLDITYTGGRFISKEQERKLIGSQDIFERGKL